MLRLDPAEHAKDALAPRLSMSAKLFGLSLGAYHYLHYSIGLMHYVKAFSM